MHGYCVVAVNGNNETVNNRQTTRHVPVAATATADRSPIHYGRRNPGTFLEKCMAVELWDQFVLQVIDLRFVKNTRIHIRGENTRPGVDTKKYNIPAVNNIIEHYTSDTEAGRM